MPRPRETLLAILLLGLVLLTFLPRVLSLDRHWASDENLWMRRSQNFLVAMQDGEFSKTYQAYHPGVTTMWLGSLALWTIDTTAKSDSSSTPFFTPERLSRIRLPIAIATGLLIFLCGFCLYRLFGGTVAVLSVAFLAIEPFLLSESRRAHTDALTALFLFLSLLLWLCYLEGNLSRRRDVIFSGISFGLACLTKSHASAFLLFMPLLLVWYIKQRNLSVARLLWSALLWLMVTLSTVLIVFPYMWTRPLFLLLCGMSGVLLVWSWRNISRAVPVQLTHRALELLLGLLLTVIGCTVAAWIPIFKAMFWALSEAHEFPKLFLGDIRYNPGWLYFPVVVCVWSGLLTLPLIGFAMYGAWCQRSLKDNKIFRITVVIAIFVLFYLLGLSIVAKKISRYQVIFLPAVSLLTALGGLNIAQRFSKKWICYAFLVVAFVLQAVPVLRLHPYYRAYYHPLLSGKWVAENTTCITGAGLDLAADYLNAKPNAEKLWVRMTWITKEFGHYFVGNTLQRHHHTETNSRDFDYDIEYLRDKQLAGQIPVDAPENYQVNDMLGPGTNRAKLSRLSEPEHVIRLNGINYVWIYRVLDSPTTVDTRTQPKIIEQVK